MEEPILPITIKEIINLLPHRYPFLLIDRIDELNLEKGTIVGHKNVTFNESFFQGHFPGAPIMPGVLILEALAQAGAVLVYLKGGEGKLAVLLSIKEVKFRTPVHPGDTMRLCGEVLKMGSKGGRIRAIASVGEKTAVEADVSFALVDKNKV